MIDEHLDDPLTAVMRYIEGRYRQFFRDKLWTLDATTSALDRPTWTWQSHDLHDTSSKATATGGLLLDPEIGTCLYFVDYHRQPNVRETVARALAIRQQLLPKRGGDIADADATGPWRVVINWLVDGKVFADWIKQTAEIRERTGHFEEIGVDAILRENQSWAAACSNHGIPRTLLSVREVMAKTNVEEIESWRSADIPVMEAITALPAHFRDPFTVQCAQQVVAAVSATFNDNSTVREDSKYPELMSMEVRNFRNIDDLKVNFRSPAEPVSSTIIQGPNGSGKSAVFEAISFALSGSSVRYLKFLNDNNRKLISRDDDYISNYIRPKWGLDMPVIRINGAVDTSPVQSPADAVKDNVQRLGSNLFSQECTSDFVTTPAQELASEIASSFSEIAAEAQEYLDSALDAAQTQQRQFNADWGIRANVLRRDTVIERVVDVILNGNLAPIQGILSWLRVEQPVEFLPIPRMRLLAANLETWQASAQLTIKNLMGADTFESRRERFLEFFQDGLAAKTPVKEFADEIARRTREWPTDHESTVERLGVWLQARRQAGDKDSAEVSIAKAQRTELTEQLNATLAKGNLLRGHDESLRAALALMPLWRTEHDATCPTCLSTVAPKSITDVVQDVARTVGEQLIATRNEFASIRQRLDDSAAKLAALGADEPPVPYDEQANLLTSIFWLLPDGVNFEEFIADADSRQYLVRTMQHMRRIPSADFGSSDIGFSADEANNKLEAALDQFQRVAAAPVAWKEVRDRLQSELVKITSAHLPKTILSVWSELIQNMLPAPWQYPGHVEFRVERNRSANQVAVVVRDLGQTDALAAHILNGAETHNLGLAWFLTRYLTDGRFRLSALVLDDPAQSMDQPTYRDFCRLMETFMRLHRRHNIPLSLVLLLHQDSRAVDAARATEGILYQLRWNKRTPVSLKRIILHDEGSSAPKPSNYRSSV